MNDDAVIKLLQEIRDLQRQHVENYKDALRNQQESIQLQKAWQAQAQRRLRLVLVAIVLIVAVMLALPYLMRHPF